MNSNKNMKAIVSGAMAFIVLLSGIGLSVTAKSGRNRFAVSDTAKIIKIKHAPKPPKSPKVPKDQLRRKIVKDSTKKA